MDELLEWLDSIVDLRQRSKVRHSLKDIVVIVLFAILANADDWVEIELFAQAHIDFLRQYIELRNGIPSHDTIQRVMAMISPNVMQQIQGKWKEIINGKAGKKIQGIVAIDGKTMRGNTRNGSKPSHIVSAWCDEDGFCLGQEAVDEKSNEIKAIPALLDRIAIRGQIVTIDAMGTQTAIAAKIRSKGADYVLALKGNQSSLRNDVEEYFEDDEFRKEIQKEGNYKKTFEKAHGQFETREYYQTGDVQWLEQRENWKGLQSIGMERTTITRKNGETVVEKRYFISSLAPNIELFSKAVRKHWSVESMHWHLDVTFHEDANRTADKISAQNLNIVRKICLSALKVMEIFKPKLSIKKKRFIIGQIAEQLLATVVNS